MTNRLPLSANESERRLIGCALAIIQNPADWNSSVERVVGRHFLDDGLGEAWDGLMKLRRAGKPYDLRFLVGELRRLTGDDPTELLSDIAREMPNTVGMPHYAEQVIEAWRIRELQSLGEVIHAQAVGGTAGGADEIATRARKKLDEVLNEGATTTIVSLQTATREVIEAKTSGKVTLIPSGQKKLDEIIGGFPLGGFSLIGGRPGMGKSQELKQVLLNIARDNTAAGLVTVEENRIKVGENMLANLSNLENKRIVQNRLDVNDLQLLEQWADAAVYPFWIEDAQFGIDGVCRSIRRMVNAHSVKVVGVDYIQLIDSDERENENAKITALSQSLKRLARELQIAVIAAAQLNRKAGADERRPKLTDLRGSGSLEQDGDLILLLHREDYYHADELGYIKNGLLEVDIAKNKGGNRGVVELYWDGDHQRIF